MRQYPKNKKHNNCFELHPNATPLQQRMVRNMNCCSSYDFSCHSHYDSRSFQVNSNARKSRRSWRLYDVVLLLVIVLSLVQRSMAAASSCSNINKINNGSSSSSYRKDARIALAGGIAGATGTALLYPIDAAKTLRQTDPKKYTSIVVALRDLFFPIVKATTATAAARAQFQPIQAYRGVISSTLAAIPSSAVYFGTYEVVKNRLFKKAHSIYSRDSTHTSSNNSSNNNDKSHIPPAIRMLIHGASAICGNAASSLIFVPKEYVKQQLQAYGSGKLKNPTPFLHAAAAAAAASEDVWCTTAGCVISETLQRDGIRGLYSGYKATILRNIPTAVLRFALYEEIKLRLASGNNHMKKNKNSNNNEKTTIMSSFNPLFFVSGAIAGALASGIMTPVDVLKTRFATGNIPKDLGLLDGFKYICNQHGWAGLYAGAPTRMVWSAAFSAIGLGTFEVAKQMLGVADNSSNNNGSISISITTAATTAKVPVLYSKEQQQQQRLVYMNDVHNRSRINNTPIVAVLSNHDNHSKEGHAKISRHRDVKLPFSIQIAIAVGKKADMVYSNVLC